MKTLQDVLAPHIEKCVSCLDDPSKAPYYLQAQVALDFYKGLLAGRFLQHFPSDFFKSEKLHASEALLSFAGIDPRQLHDIDWKGNPSPVVYACNFFYDAQLFDSVFSAIRGNIPWIDIHNELERKTRRNWLSLFKEQNLEGLSDYTFQVAMRHEMFLQAQLKLEKLFWHWMRRKDAIGNFFDPEELHEVSYYLDWIKRTGIEDYVPWWAHKVSGKAPSVLGTVEKESSKQKNNLFGLIGIFLNIMVGEGKKFPSESALKNFISKNYSHLGGTSERYLSDVFSQAKKVKEEKSLQ